MKNVKADQENETKSQPLGDKDKKNFWMWNVKFWMCCATYSTFIIQVAYSNGFGINHLRI